MYRSQFRWELPLLSYWRLFVNNLKGFWSNFFRSAYFVPTMMPLFLAASIWRWMYAPEVGIINRAIGIFGIESINWLKDPSMS